MPKSDTMIVTTVRRGRRSARSSSHVRLKPRRPRSSARRLGREGAGHVRVGEAQAEPPCVQSPRSGYDGASVAARAKPIPGWDCG